MSMTRKHFTKFADMLAYSMPNPADAGEYMVWQNMGQSISDIFKNDNPNFDRVKFNSYIMKKAKELGKTVT